jgi:hypothetical protein
MNPHSFILSAHGWMGEGTIVLNMVEEELNFFTKWFVQEKNSIGSISSIQEIQIAGISEVMRNELTFFDFSSKGFSVEMENANIGKVVGIGVMDDNLIAWEFRQNDLNFEGFETYHLLKDGSYKMHAEYVTSDQFRTQINGRIWIPPNGFISKETGGEEENDEEEGEEE